MTVISSGEQRGYGRALPATGAISSTQEGGYAHLGKRKEHDPVKNSSTGNERFHHSKVSTFEETYLNLAKKKKQNDYYESDNEGREQTTRDGYFYRYKLTNELPYRQQIANATYIENQRDHKAKHDTGELLNRVDLHA